MATKHAGTTKRFGARYSRKLKVSVEEIEASTKGTHPCPKCSETALTRTQTGVWGCSHCGAKIAGGAYYPVPIEKKQKKPVSVVAYETEKPAKALPAEEK